MELLSNLISLNALVIKPTLEIITERQKRTTGFQKEAALLEKEAAGVLQQYETRINAARNEARQKRDAILFAAHQQQRDVIQQARKKMEADLASTRNEIRANIQRVREELKTHTQELAAAITKKLLEREAA
jgi:F0F1-type ATP synthase membrane subunit b/b'